MIVALEGPCFSGKSTLFRTLQDRADELEDLRPHVHWIQFRKTEVYGMQVPHYTYETLLIQLFSMMYHSKDDLVISDRILTVTSVVYNRIRREPISREILSPWWLGDLRVLYLTGSKGIINEVEGYPVRLKELEEFGTQSLELPMMPIDERTELALAQIKQWCG